jgi:hypothetical protein
MPQQQLAFLPVQLGRQPTLSCPFDDLESLIQQA